MPLVGRRRSANEWSARDTRSAHPHYGLADDGDVATVPEFVTHDDLADRRLFELSIPACDRPNVEFDRRAGLVQMKPVFGRSRRHLYKTGGRLLVHRRQHE